MKGAARATEEKSMGFQENILMRTSAPEHLLISALEYSRPVPESIRGNLRQETCFEAARLTFVKRQ